MGKKEAVVPPAKKGASPIPPQKSPLKRQSSRTSVYKACDEKEETEEAEASDSENPEEKTPRRSNRGEKEKSESEKKPKALPRSNSGTRMTEKKEKAETETEEEQEGKKISDSVISQPSVRLGKMRSLTPIKKNQKIPETTTTTDPYVLQEPDESPTTKFETPTKGVLELADDDVRRSPKESKTAKAMKREESEKTAIDSGSTENIPDIPGEVFKILTPVNSGDSGEEPEKTKVDTESAATPKEEEEKEKKPFLQM